MRLLLFTTMILLIHDYSYGQRPAYGGKLKPEQANIDVRHYTIDINVDIPGQRIDGTTTIRLLIKEPASILLFDLMDSFTVRQLWVNDKPAPFTLKDHLLRI